MNSTNTFKRLVAYAKAYWRRIVIAAILNTTYHTVKIKAKLTYVRTRLGKAGISANAVPLSQATMEPS